MEKARTVLFVCTGNTCRSPLAEAVFRQKAAEAGMPCEVRSAGLSAWPGDVMTADALKVLREQGLNGSSHRSARVSQWIMDWATDIFAMTGEHYRVLIQAFPDRVMDIHLFTEPMALQTGEEVRDIPDPYGRGMSAYRKVAVDMEEAIPFLVEFLRNK